MIDWKNAFSKGKFPWKNEASFRKIIDIQDLNTLKSFLDEVHIRSCLLKPYTEIPEYPLVETRMLLPSFEVDPYEYTELPGFSMVVLDRPLNSFNELFQYDPLLPVSDVIIMADGPCCPLEHQVFNANTQTFLSRLPRALHESYKTKFNHIDVTLLDYYPALMPAIMQMDRAHVLAKTRTGFFQLAGLFASLPSDIDGELKRFGLRIGKFHASDSELYQRNRLSTLQFLMELYGFPIASERRTSAALFARRLHKIGERFLIRVIGQSDRTLTTIWNDGTCGQYPHVEKIALIRIDDELTETIEELKKLNAFVDEENHVVIARIGYQQHAYSASNVRQDRALSVEGQAIIHPITGENITHINVLRDVSSLLLRLNDIARGEFTGRTVYKRNEVIENSDTEEKRLKTFYSWLIKNQRRIIGYSDESYNSFILILDNYFNSIDYIDNAHPLYPLKTELNTRYSYISQARTLRFLEDIKSRNFKGEQLSYDGMLTETVKLLHDYKFELTPYFEELVSTAIKLVESILNDRYLQRTYIEKNELLLTPKGLDIRKKYRALVQLHDEFKSIQKTHNPVE